MRRKYVTILKNKLKYQQGMSLKISKAQLIVTFLNYFLIFYVINDISMAYLMELCFISLSFTNTALPKEIVHISRCNQFYPFYGFFIM